MKADLVDLLSQWCATLPKTLIESELFGMKEDLISVAARSSGKIELAHEGTLFLDEIGDMPVDPSLFF